MSSLLPTKKSIFVTTSFPDTSRAAQIVKGLSTFSVDWIGGGSEPSQAQLIHPLFGHSTSRGKNGQQVFFFKHQILFFSFMLRPTRIQIPSRFGSFRPQQENTKRKAKKKKGWNIAWSDLGTSAVISGDERILELVCMQAKGSEVEENNGAVMEKQNQKEEKEKESKNRKNLMTKTFENTEREIGIVHSKCPLPSRSADKRRQSLPVCPPTLT